MAQLIIQVLAFIAAAAIVVDATVMVGVTLPNGKRKRSANFQGYSCQAEIEVDKRNENSVDFRVCVDHGVVCTDKDVSACSKEAKECKSFESPDKEMFAQMFPDAYAEVCVESTGVQCLYTDVEYETCDHAEMMSDNEICITLSNGEVECAEIPEEYLLQRMIQNAQLPQYIPEENKPQRSQANKAVYWPWKRASDEN